MELAIALKQIGLNQSEIRVYLFLLENGVSVPPIVSRRTKIARTNCYNILNELKNKGLIEEEVVGKRKAYKASDPESLLQALDRKRLAIQQVLPDLHSLHATHKNKPKIKFYSGLEPVRLIFEEALSASTVFSVGALEEMNKIIPGYRDYYIGELTKRNSRLVDKNTNNIPTAILSWDNNVAFISAEEPTFGTVLNNLNLAKTIQILVEFDF